MGTTGEKNTSLQQHHLEHRTLSWPWHQGRLSQIQPLCSSKWALKFPICQNGITFLLISDRSDSHYRLLSWMLSWTLSLVKHKLVRPVSAHHWEKSGRAVCEVVTVSPGSGTGDKATQGTCRGTARPAWCTAVLGRTSAGSQQHQTGRSKLLMISGWAGVSFYTATIQESFLTDWNASPSGRSPL